MKQESNGTRGRGGGVVLDRGSHINDHAERRAKRVRSSVGLGIRTTHGHTEPKTTASYEHCGSEPVHDARHDG